jgi:hypothetical protein
MIADRVIYKILILVFAVQAISCSRNDQTQLEIENLKAIEARRLESLVDANIDVASRLHADDFQLITPNGNVFSKEQYLGQISDSRLDYVSWEPSEITVRLYDDVAAIRYQDSDFLVVFDGEPVWTGQLKHTNVYEKRDGNWVVVWSHASGGGPPEKTE